MEKFNLNTWLEDKSRKIVTRDGKPARIICYDVKKGKQDDYNVPIIALVDRGEEIGEMSYYYSEDGRFLKNPDQTHNFDLFFADEEEELTDFEKAVEKTMPYKIQINMLKSISQQLLDLAIKEIEKENPYSGNQKQEWSEEDEKLYISALWHIKNSCGNGGKDSGEFEVYNWLQSLKDRVQPKQEWNEEDEKMWSQVINEIEAIKSNSSTIFEKNIAQDKIDWLKSIKDRVQPKPKQEWSEKDEHCIELLLPIIDSSSLIPKNRKKCKEFLKSLKDRVQPQSKQEWSEEDKSMYIRTLGILGKCYMGELPTKVEEELKWFKSITDKAQPQANQYDKGYEDGYSAAKYNQWKPKKEELEALRKRTYFCEGIDANLDSLYTNLLKL